MLKIGEVGVPEPESIGVIYVTDEKYHELTEFSICSLAIHLQSPVQIYFFQIGYRKPLTVDLISYLSAAGHSVELIYLDMDCIDSDVSLHEHISPVTLLKAVAIQHVVRSHKYLVFLDSDTLMMTECSLRPVCNFKTTFAGVYDFVSYMKLDGQNLFEHANKTGQSPYYFNAGVIFINSEQWIANKVLSKYNDNLQRHARHCPYRHDSLGNDPGDCKGADQCAFNMSAQDDWTPLTFEWNAQKTIRHTRFWNSAFIRHYTGHRKFLSYSNRHRDLRESKTLKLISREIGISPKNRLRAYDFGILYLIDLLYNFKTMIDYRIVLRKLNLHSGRHKMLIEARFAEKGVRP